MSGVGAFIVGAAVGAVVAKQHQKNKHHQHHHHQSSRTVVVHHPPQPVHQTYPVYVNKHGHPHGPPHGHPHGPSYGHPNGPPYGHPQGPTHGHQPHHYGPPQPQSTQVYYQSIPAGPGYPAPIGFVCPPSPASPQGPPPSSYGGYPSPYPPTAAPCGYSNPHAPPQQGGYPPLPSYDSYPPQSLGIPPTSPGYPTGGYPPLSNSSQHPPAPLPPQPSGYPFASPPAHPQPASAAPFQPPQHLQAQVTVQLSAVSNQQTSAGSNAIARPNRRCFVVLNEETRYALQVDTVASSKLVMRQRTVTGSWDPQWQGQVQGQGQMWYLDGEGILRSQLNDLAIESKDGGSWLCLAPYCGDSRQQWILREGRILANKVSPSDCICLEEGLMGTAVNADVIVTKYQARPHHHWVIEYV